MAYPNSMEKLIESFQKLPGIGIKSAERMTFSVMDLETDDVNKFAQALMDIKNNLCRCEICNHITDDKVCSICTDDTRENDLICIVEDSRDVFAMEKAGTYKGKYHVLNKVISPIDGIGPEDLKLEKLITRIKDNNVKEIIMATNPNIEGETTALYIAKVLSNMDVEVSRIAHGIPIGGDLEYADELTITSALEGRRKI